MSQERNRSLLYINVIIICSLLFCLNSFAQISGNQLYSNNSSNGSNRSLNSIQTTDSTLFIRARILLNKKSDYFIVSLGVSQEAESVEEGVRIINERINKFLSDLKSIKIKKEEYYVDFISQTKVYDYKFEGNKAQQYDYGFEIKKNIIVKLSDISKFDELTALASKQAIYDVIKVDYRNYDTEEIYQQMFDEAVKIVNKKKDIFLKVSDVKLSGKSRIASDDFYTIYPSKQYEKYQAYESSTLKLYSGKQSSSFFRKEERKTTTYFYDGKGGAGVDKVINADMVVVGIQYELYINMIYEIQR